jgi:2',3'-cyclic-nucleotide 2'-phosphodiesterase (5'-nucleotidase family)
MHSAHRAPILSSLIAAAALCLPSAPAHADGFGQFRAHARVALLRCVKSYLTELQIGHSSDNESSFQDPNTLEEKVLNYATVNRGLQLMAQQDCVPMLHLTAGDHTIPGPYYQAAAEVESLGAPGLGDIAIYNAMGLDANGIGNHEFDGTIDEFAAMLRRARYPFLAANLDFSQVKLADGVPNIRIAPNGRYCGASRGKVTRSCWTIAGGQKVGLIGRAPADFFNVIEDPANTLGGLDFVGGRDPATNQPLVSAVGQVLEQVELLEAQGVRRIVLLDHAQDFTGDPLSASALRGIDIVIAAGTTGFMAQPAPRGPFNLLREGDTPEADYPTVRKDSEGEMVLVVNSDQLFRYQGNLRVRFDARGHIVDIDKRVSGPVATSYESIRLLEHVVGRRLHTPVAVDKVYQALQATPLIQDAFTVVGQTNFPLNGQRVDVRSRETNLGRVTADSTLWFARSVLPGVDVALKNGGGIRDTIVGPSIIRLTIQAALAFDNQLGIVELSAAQLIATMENAVSRVPALDGRFPQLAGMTLEYDATLPALEAQLSVTAPSRVRNLRIERADGSTDVLVQDGVSQGDLTRSFVLATNSFLVTGGDGYAALAAATPLLTTAIGEQQILADYIAGPLGGAVSEADPAPAPRVLRLDPPL